MKNEDPYISIVDSVFSQAVKSNLLQLNATDAQMNGRTVDINGKTLLNFSSCSYLGLELDPRLRQGAIDALDHYGTQFASSRGYISSPDYVEFEKLLSELYQAYPLVFATTTLGSIATLPVVIGPKDAIILDVQVHSSVQLAASLCRMKGSPTVLIKHSQMDKLEEAILDFRNKGAKNIWYCADGIYSMFGDLAPVDDIIKLLNKYDNFYLYIDDAHGAGWTGEHGKGSVLGHRPIHPKMIVAISFAKSYATAGAAILYPNYEWLRKVKNCGGPSSFSGPIQPPLLGAALASLKLHMSDEIYAYQKEEHDKILYCNELLKAYNLPVLSYDITPIRFIGVGLFSVACRLVERLMEAGYFTNLALFPAVPIKRSGVRFVIHRQLKTEDIKELVEAFHHYLPLVLAEENYELDFLKTFGDVLSTEYKNQLSEKIVQKQPVKHKLQLTTFNTIHDIDRAEWNRYLGDRGTFTWEGQAFLESAFSNNPKPENNWKFHYYIIRDAENNVVLMTPFITTIYKDDMFSAASVSEKIEQDRKHKNDPYYLTSKSLIMGSLFSEGNHLYLDRNRDWQSALKILIHELSQEQERDEIETIVFRDLPAADKEMHDFLLEQGYVKMALPDTHTLDNIDNTFETVVKTISSRYRRFIRHQALEKEHLYEVKIFSKATLLPTEEELDYFYKLYENVHNKGLEINGFPIPKTIFKRMMESDVWEIVALYLKEDKSEHPLPVSICGVLKGENTYCPLVIGINYDYVESHGVYRQALYQVFKRGIELQKKTIYIGMTASLQKRRFGGIPHEVVAYVQTTDTYKMEVLGQINVERKTLID